jgi:hypothetical protein
LFSAWHHQACKECRQLRSGWFSLAGFLQPFLAGGFGFGLAGRHDGAAGLRLKGAVKVQAKKQIVRRFSDPSSASKQFHQERRAENLFEIGLQLRAQPKLTNRRKLTSSGARVNASTCAASMAAWRIFSMSAG